MYSLVFAPIAEVVIVRLDSVPDVTTVDEVFAEQLPPLLLHKVPWTVADVPPEQSTNTPVRVEEAGILTTGKLSEDEGLKSTLLAV
jgi:hypothetical protein